MANSGFCCAQAGDMIYGGHKRERKHALLEIQDNIQWHPAFCSAVELELRDYKKYLTYEWEHNLGRMPLKEACKAAGTVQREVLRDPEESGDLPHCLLPPPCPVTNIRHEKTQGAYCAGIHFFSKCLTGNHCAGAVTINSSYMRVIVK